MQATNATQFLANETDVVKVWQWAGFVGFPILVGLGLAGYRYYMNNKSEEWGRVPKPMKPSGKSLHRYSGYFPNTDRDIPLERDKYPANIYWDNIERGTYSKDTLNTLVDTLTTDLNGREGYHEREMHLETIQEQLIVGHSNQAASTIEYLRNAVRAHNQWVEETKSPDFLPEELANPSAFLQGWDSMHIDGRANFRMRGVRDSLVENLDYDQSDVQYELYVDEPDEDTHTYHWEGVDLDRGPKR